MAAGDADDAPYDLLRAPASLPRGESITSQLQREILGDFAVDHLADDPNADPDADSLQSHANANSDDLPTVRANIESNDRRQHSAAPSTPTDPHEQHHLAREPDAETEARRRRRRADEIEIATPESLSQSESRRHTLSPTKALLFFGSAAEGDESDADDDRLADDVAREVTASTRRETVSPEAIRALLRDLGGGDSDGRRAAPARSQDSELAGAAGDDRATLETALQGVARTKEYVASSKGLLQQEQQTPERSRRRRSSGSSQKKKTRSTRHSDRDRDGDEREQDSFTDAFFSTKLLNRKDESNHEQEGDAAALPTRRSTLEPMDAELIFAELREGGADTRRTSPARSSPAATSRSPLTRSRRRRTTLDPDELLAIRDGSAIDDSPARRRETIGETELDELQREIGGGRESPPRRRSPRRQQSASPDVAKRTRFDDNDVVITIAEDAVDSNTRSSSVVSPRSIKITPMKRRQRVEPAEDQTFLSPPPGPAQGKTPLKSCLSAKKKAKGVTTPNKSVNFGPPQGAQFNRGSPSTSMTPMCAREAKAMFPLEEKPQNQEEDDDETSLNTSLLDEADALDEEEKDGNDDVDTEIEVDARKLSTGPTFSNRNRRRYSLRGVSPLDNQANARRQRRQSLAASQASPLVSARNREKAAAAAAATAAEKATARSSFLSADAVLPQGRLAYADSSASSDEGEDMEITADYSNQAITATSLHHGSLSQQDKTNSPTRSPSTLKQSSGDSLFVDSPLADNTVELGTLGDLLSESVIYEEQPASEEEEMEVEEETAGERSLGSLSDLAREADDVSDPRPPMLEPIVEDDEDKRSSVSAMSMMSLDMDDSDTEYEEKRKSLVVNLSSKFDRIGSVASPEETKKRSRSSSQGSSPKRPRPSPKKDPRASPSQTLVAASQPTPSPPKEAPPLVLLEVAQVLERADVEAIETEPSVLSDDVAASVGDSKTTQLCLADVAAPVIRSHLSELAAWSASLAVLSSLSTETAPPVFSDSMLDESRLESIRQLFSLECTSVQSGFSQWRRKLEVKLCEGLKTSQNMLRADIRQVRSAVTNDLARRESELNAMRELIERERQMSGLLDGIEEQQSVQREFQSSVEQLESECSALSLEDSVLAERLTVLQSDSITAPEVSETTEAELRAEVLEAEETIAVRESLSLWRVNSATPSHVELSTTHEDVLFTLHFRVSVRIHSTSTPGSIDVEPRLTRKKVRRHEEDAVFVVAARLMETLRSSSPYTADSSVVDLVQAAETSVGRLFQFLRDLRSVSLVCGLRFESSEGRLHLEFVRFPKRSISDTNKVVDGLKFQVSGLVASSWPYTSSDVSVDISYGTVTKEKILQQIETSHQQTAGGTTSFWPLACRHLRRVFLDG
ncbi:hypothetical protein PINS_up007183 [Pythium insidiosum]|nr:hypothetical protein PINS_up007183 [Pythium insidiosum]